MALKRFDRFGPLLSGCVCEEEEEEVAEASITALSSIILEVCIGWGRVFMGTRGGGLVITGA